MNDQPNAAQRQQIENRARELAGEWVRKVELRRQCAEIVFRGPPATDPVKHIRDLYAFLIEGMPS